jgi:tetratricopeptide (TPR) repeat protein
MSCCRRWIRVAAACVLTAAAWSQAPAPGQREFAEALQLAGQGRYEEAEKALRALERAHPGEAEIGYRLGLVLLRQGKSGEAAERLEAAAQAMPGSPLVWLSVAQARLKLERREAALEAAGRAAGLARGEPPVLRALAMFHAEAADFARAADYEAQWGKATPADTGSPLRLAHFRLRAGDGPGAVEAARQALARQESAEAWRVLGQASRAVKNPAQAVEAFQKAIRLAPGEPEAYFELAALFLDHRTPEPAAVVLESAVARFPKEPEFRRLLGLAYYQTGENARAIDAFLAITDLDPDSEVGYASLETLLAEAGPKLGEIVTHLRAFRERRPASPVGHFLLAKALLVEGGSEPAEAALREAIKAEPRFWPAYFELGTLLEARGDGKGATQALARAVELNPDYAPAHYSLSRLYASLGDRRLAVEHRRRHHELAEREREAAEKRRAESPALPYRLESGSEPAGRRNGR